MNLVFIDLTSYINETLLTRSSGLGARGARFRVRGSELRRASTASRTCTSSTVSTASCSKARVSENKSRESTHRLWPAEPPGPASWHECSVCEQYRRGLIDHFLVPALK
jgi:hypothetical protein